MAVPVISAVRDAPKSADMITDMFRFKSSLCREVCLSLFKVLLAISAASTSLASEGGELRLGVSAKSIQQVETRSEFDQTDRTSVSGAVAQGSGSATAVGSVTVSSDDLEVSGHFTASAAASITSNPIKRELSEVSEAGGGVEFVTDRFTFDPPGVGVLAEIEYRGDLLSSEAMDFVSAIPDIDFEESYGAFASTSVSLQLGSRGPSANAFGVFQGVEPVFGGEHVRFHFGAGAAGGYTGFGDGPYSSDVHGAGTSISGTASFELRIIEDRLHWSGTQSAPLTGIATEWLECLPISRNRYAVFNSAMPRQLTLTLDDDLLARGVIVDGEDIAIDLNGKLLEMGNDSDSRKTFNVAVGEARAAPSMLTLRNGRIQTTKGIRLHSLPDNPVTLILENGVEAASGVSLKGLSGFPAMLDIRGTGTRTVDGPFGALNEPGSGIHIAEVLDHSTMKISGGAVIGRNSDRLLLTKVGATDGLAFVEIKDSGTSVATDFNVGIGLDGAGLMHVLDGAEFSAVEINVGDTTSSSTFSGDGELLVDGIDSMLSAQTLTISRGLFIRSQGGGTDATFSKGVVSVGGGAELDVRDVFVGETPFTEGHLTITGTDSKATIRNLSLGLQNPNFTVMPGQVVTGAPAATGRVEVRDGGTLQVTNNFETVNYPGADILHDLLVTGAGSRFDAETTGGAKFSPENTAIKIANGGTAKSNPLQISGLGRFQITDPSSAWDVNGTLELGFLGTPGHAEILNGGALHATNINVGTVTSDSTLRVSGSGSVAIVNGTVLAGLRNRSIANVPAGDIGGDTTLTVENGGGLIADDVFLGPTSMLKGDGGTILADVFSIGFIAPGSSPGTLTIDGDLNMNGGAILLEISGPDPGTQHDQLIVTGDLNITNGTIDLVFIDGFAPTAGQTFSLLNVGGQFQGVPPVRAVNVNPDWQFQTAFDPGTGGFTLTAITNATFTVPSAIPVELTITPATTPATGYDFAWVSRPGKVYDLVSSTDLATPISEWPVYPSYGDIPATGTATTLTAVPKDGPRRFYAVIEKDAPPAN